MIKPGKKFINSTLADAANKMIARVRTHWKETIIFLAVIAGATKVFVNLTNPPSQDNPGENPTQLGTSATSSTTTVQQPLVTQPAAQWTSRLWNAWDKLTNILNTIRGNTAAIPQILTSDPTGSTASNPTNPAKTDAPPIEQDATLLTKPAVITPQFTKANTQELPTEKEYQQDTLKQTEKAQTSNKKWWQIWKR